ncbi:hypothetical protein KZP23_21735 [Echinicola marina]|uniref:hypothetical protein n=1 Tax=Echinicola marina TaxID=2859768 RepID=UPI001CF620C4|nr:hypothetical protein [Echinicola marina]UCS93239.1 hypothetical protein KZP23_21735 [Echinicola marina]
MLKYYKLIKQKIISINWGVTWEEEEKILKELSLQRKNFDDSYIYDSIFQFKAQVYFLKNTDKIILWIVSMFGFFILLLKNFFPKKSIKEKNTYDIAYFYSKTIFSNELVKGKRLVYIEPRKGELLFRDIVYLLGVLVKTQFNFGLLAISVYRIAQIRYAIEAYNVKSVWVNMEYSASCGIVRDFCHHECIELNNFMHGEKLLTLRDAFCSFDKFYVWDLHYKGMFEELMFKGEIIIDNPFSICGNKKKKFKSKNSVCYFLKGIESPEELRIINEVLSNITRKGYFVKVKDHPRQKVCSNKLKGVSILESEGKDISEILCENEYIIAQYSTVLIQGWSMGSKVVIDDVSNETLIKELEDRSYFFFKKKEKIYRLSEFLSK